MSDRTYGIVLVTVATVLWGTAGLFVRLLDLDVWATLGWRSLFGAVALGLIILVQDRMPGSHDERFMGWIGGAAAVMSGISMFCYIAALKLTTVANVLTIYATVPFMAAGLAFLWSREKPEARVLWASGIALVGVMIVAGFPTRPGDLAGTALAFVMTLTFSAVLVMARRYPALRMSTVNAVGASLCALVSLPLSPGPIPSLGQLALLAVFGFTSSALAYLLFLTGGRYIPSGEAGLIALLDVILGPFWVWLVFAENPGPAAITGAGFILVAVAWYLSGTLRQPSVAR